MTTDTDVGIKRKCNVVKKIEKEKKLQKYVVSLRGDDNPIPPHIWIMDVTMTHDRYGRTTQHTNGALTHRVSTTGPPHPDGALKNATRKKILQYRQIYVDKPDPIIFFTVVVNTSGHGYDDFFRLIFLFEHRETSVLAGELPEGSDQFRFL